MTPSVKVRLRIVIALVIAFLISGYLERYSNENGAVPTLAFRMLTADTRESLSKGTSAIAASISSVHIPALFSFVPPSLEQAVPTEAPTPTESVETPFAVESTPTPIALPTIDAPMLIATDIPPSPTLRPSPTVKPTDKPKPTAVPTATPTPLAPKEFIRPGTDLEDIFKIAGQKSCVPVTLLKSMIAQESPGVLTYSERSALFYNAYDWWHRVTEKKQVCSGYGYYPETGLIAEDSLFAGERCKEAFSAETANDTVSKALGPSQMLNYYWEKTFKDKTQKALGVDKADRRVLLDGLTAFGIMLREGVKPPGGCDGWDFKYIIKAACVNTGGHCEYYNYCSTICRNYNKFAGQNNSCDTVASMFVPNSYCQFK